MASGNIDLDFYKLNDMNFTGGATFTATNAVEDDGNNSGISITMLGSTPIDYYWVGGTGNWSDPTQWALSSGGCGTGSNGLYSGMRMTMCFLMQILSRHLVKR